MQAANQQHFAARLTIIVVRHVSICIIVYVVQYISCGGMCICRKPYYQWTILSFGHGNEGQK